MRTTEFQQQMQKNAPKVAPQPNPIWWEYRIDFPRNCEVAPKEGDFLIVSPDFQSVEFIFHQLNVAFLSPFQS